MERTYRYTRACRVRQFFKSVDKRVEAVRRFACPTTLLGSEVGNQQRNRWKDQESRRLGRQLWQLGTVELARREA